MNRRRGLARKVPTEMFLDRFLQATFRVEKELPTGDNLLIRRQARKHLHQAVAATDAELHIARFESSATQCHESDLPGARVDDRFPRHDSGGRGRLGHDLDSRVHPLAEVIVLVWNL